MPVNIYPSPALKSSIAICTLQYPIYNFKLRGFLRETGGWLPAAFFKKKTQFSELQNRRKSFSCSWLLEAGGWPLSQKQTQSKPIFQDKLSLHFAFFFLLCFYVQKQKEIRFVMY
ncbi:MAG: hypothetical protein L0Y36_07220 [Planctomycetales bacterium]|nr:hypothetical protein [Planctomycetales bacterium]